MADLLDIVEQMAAAWAGLPPLVEGRPDYRQAVIACRTVYAVAIDAQALTPDVIELVAIRIQTQPQAGAWPDPDAPEDDPEFD